MITHTSGNLVACICEGTAEREIVNMLLDAGKFPFHRDDLLGGTILTGSNRSSKKFQSTYLSLIYDEGVKIEVLRFMDSDNDPFKVSRAYEDKLAYVSDILTRPEIEMLIIHAEDKYKDYQKYKSNTKPNDYCKEKLAFPKVKTTKFIQKYFADLNLLIEAIKKYDENKPDKSQYSIWQLIDRT